MRTVILELKMVVTLEVNDDVTIPSAIDYLELTSNETPKDGNTFDISNQCITDYTVLDSK